jgi:hypothetical protein
MAPGIGACWCGSYDEAWDGIRREWRDKARGKVARFNGDKKQRIDEVLGKDSD